MPRLKLGMLIAAMLALGAAGGGYAQESSATPQALPAVECTVAPISFERLTSVIATPITDTAPPEASPAAAGLPAGEPADEVTSAVVHNTITQLVACINAGDSLRGLELYSDRFVREAFAGVNVTREMYDTEALNLQPRAAGEEVVLYSFGDVVIMEDGRAAVIVTGDDLISPEDASGTLFYLVNQNGTWYVDETVEDAA
jgi:hypothetical protein